MKCWGRIIIIIVIVIVTVIVIVIVIVSGGSKRLGGRIPSQKSSARCRDEEGREEGEEPERAGEGGRWGQQGEKCSLCRAKIGERERGGEGGKYFRLVKGKCRGILTGGRRRAASNGERAGGVFFLAQFRVLFL